MKTFGLLKFALLFLGIFSLLTTCKTPLQQSSVVNNPLLPGYFADPSVVVQDGKYYVYVTADPWGTEFLSCWESDDFVNWKFNKLNWPTKATCTSPLSGTNNVWAPSVIERNGKYYMYVSVGSEVWCGVADSPMGEWRNMLGDKPLLAYDTTRYCHVIDAEVFADDDGKYYLYWGSGWDWKDGRCYVAELSDDMSSFKGDPREITPSGYFEAPFMLKHNGKYYLMYSDGKTIEDTYKVRYAVGDSPMGDFVEGANSPILQTDSTRNVYGPGHHTIVKVKDEYFILYHRHLRPFKSGTAFRQLCADRMVFTPDGLIDNITPSESVSMPFAQATNENVIPMADIEASSQRETYSGVENLSDRNNSTLWSPAISDQACNLILSLDAAQGVGQLELLFEYPWKSYPFNVEISSDGIAWSSKYANVDGEVGSPCFVPINAECRYIKLSFTTSASLGLWEVRVLK